METRSFQSYKRQQLAERLPLVNSVSCVSPDVRSEENLLQQQLGEFWSYAVDFPNRYGNHQNETNFEEECSLENQLLYQDFLTRPAKATLQRKKTSSSLVEQNCVLRGEDIKDVPTTYVISGLDANEFPVIGTYVDLRILPGFQYKSISIGYGKRLTFESKCLNDNKNYFWSDSRPEGFGFSLVVLKVGDRLQSSVATNNNDSKTVLEVKRVLSQKEINTSVQSNGDVVKTVLVEFICQTTSVGSAIEMKASGLAFLVKGRNCRRCRLERIETDFSTVLQRMELRPLN